MMFHILLSICFIIWFVRFLWKNSRVLKLSYQLRNKYIPLPIVGHGYMFLGSDIDHMNTVQKLSCEVLKRSGLTGVWLGHQFYTVIADAEAADIVLKTCINKGSLMKVGRKLTGNGTLFAPPKVWRPRRKLLVPTFAPKNLVSFFDIFLKNSAVLIESLEEAPENETISLWKYISSYTMESVCETALGVSVQNESKKEFLVAFDEFCELAAARAMQPWLQIDKLYNLLPSGTKFYQARDIIWKFVDEIIKSKREENKTSNYANFNEDAPKTFLELLMESSKDDNMYSDKELREEILVLVLAGTDTSAVGTSFTTVMLSRFPHIQDKVFEEISEVFGDSDRPIAPEDLERLKYLDAVIRETLRLYPPVPLIVRKIDRDVNLPSGITLIENTAIIMNIWALHRYPRYWGHDAEEFKPERFLNGPLKYPNAYMPFSSGPRNCPGYRYALMSMKIVLTTLLRRYKLLPPKACDDVELQKPLQVKYDIMLRHVDNFSLRLQARK